MLEKFYYLRIALKCKIFLNALEGKGIVVVDEFQSFLINAKEYFLIDLVIDKAYQNGARIIIAGNITKEALGIFREPELKRAGKPFERLRKS